LFFIGRGFYHNSILFILSNLMVAALLPSILFQNAQRKPQQKSRFVARDSVMRPPTIFGFANENALFAVPKQGHNRSLQPVKPTHAKTATNRFGQQPAE
jgi:hypothetical protein